MGSTPTPAASICAERAFDAVIVAGMGSSRLGGADKALVEVGGRTLLARAVDNVAGAERIAVVGPRRGVDSPRISWCEEDPPGGGPVAAFAAGLACTVADRVVLLAVDLPFAGPAVTELLAADAEVAVLADGTGRLNYLCSAWRRSVALARLDALGDPAGASMRTLVAEPVTVADRGGWSADCDTWEAIELARTRAVVEGI